jgi:predicted TIM-barrel fold metal-dependent hydrolase
MLTIDSQVHAYERNHPGRPWAGVLHGPPEVTGEPPPPAQPWADLPKVLALAAHDNIAIKISGAGTLSHEPFPYKDIWDPLCRIFDAFGCNRCMWGTDWTRAVALLTYKQGVEAFRVTDRLSESDRAAVMGETLARVYNWSPPTA